MRSHLSGAQESYKGHLTPVGSSQLQAMGRMLRGRYHTLFEGRQIDGDTLAVYTSNLQRTLQSAWAFLLGFVPCAAVFFAFRSERVFSERLRRQCGAPGSCLEALSGPKEVEKRSVGGRFAMIFAVSRAFMMVKRAKIGK